MSYRTWLVFLLLSLAPFAFAQGFAPFAGPAPLAILVQKYPWDPVIGAETPRIAIYENGDVIYSRSFSQNKPEVYFYAKLDFQALAVVADQLQAVSELSGLKPAYSLMKAADQGIALFYLRVHHREVVTSVYGLTPNTINRKTSEPGSEPIPSPLLNLYQYFCTVYFPESRPWRPALVEAMIWPYDDAPGTSIPWPTTWPDLNSDRALKRNQGYSIFLDSSQQENLIKLLSGQKEKGAVEINGKKYSAAWRPVFPSEPVWRKAFSRLESN